MTQSNGTPNKLVIDFNSKLSVLRQAAQIDLLNQTRSDYIGTRYLFWQQDEDYVRSNGLQYGMNQLSIANSNNFLGYFVFIPAHDVADDALEYPSDFQDHIIQFRRLLRSLILLRGY